jgi:hypothetical protein
MELEYQVRYRHKVPKVMPKKMSIAFCSISKSAADVLHPVLFRSPRDVKRLMLWYAVA